MTHTCTVKGYFCGICSAEGDDPHSKTHNKMCLNTCNVHKVQHENYSDYTGLIFQEVIYLTSIINSGFWGDCQYWQLSFRN